MIVFYVYGWWQQYRLNRKFGAAFKASHADALYQESAVKPVPIVPSIQQIEAIDLAVDSTFQVLSESNSEDEIAPLSLLDESCSLIDNRSDFIIELDLHEPASGAVLGSFWARKFDFGKPVQVCGLTKYEPHWERVIADGTMHYVNFRIALQLVDRGGAMSASKLSDFRDLVLGVAQQIQAECVFPELSDCHVNALQLDRFCAAVDQMVGINLIPSGERLLLGSRIAQATALQGMSLESDGAFHLFDEQGFSVLSLINQDTKPFQHHNLEATSSRGLTLLLDVPRVTLPVQQFDLMKNIANGLAEELQLNLVDDHRVVLSSNGLERIREQISDVEIQMLNNNIVAGSAQARRLFS